MKIFVLAVLGWVGASCSPMPSDPSLAKAVKATMDFIHHEQQAQTADQYAQAHPTFVESNDTQQQIIGKQEPSSPKKDWELVPRTPPPSTTARYAQPHHRGAGSALPSLPPPYSYSRTTTEAYSRIPKGGRGWKYGEEDLYRRRRQVQVPADQPPRRTEGGGVVPDRSEIVIGSNAIRVSKTDSARRRQGAN